MMIGMGMSLTGNDGNNYDECIDDDDDVITLEKH